MGVTTEQQPEKDAVQAGGTTAKVKPGTDTKQGSKSQIRQSVRTMGYEEGAKTLSTQPDTDEDQREARRLTYEEALGELLGGKLFEVVSENTDPEHMMEYAGKAVDALVDLIAKQVEEGRDLDRIGPEAAAAQMENLREILRVEVEEYMASPEGQALGEKITEYVQTHPWEVVGAVLLAAAAAVAANMKLPELKQKVNLADGLDAEIKAKLGKIQAIALETISARLKYEQGRFKGEVAVDHSSESGTTASIGASYGGGTNRVSAEATVDKEGLMKAGLGARGQKGLLGGSADVKHFRNAGTVADAKVTYGGKDDKVSGGAQYDFKEDLLSLQLSRELTKGLYSGQRSIGLEDGTVTGATRDRVGTDRTYMEMTSSSGKDNSKVGVAAGYGRGPLDLTGAFSQDSKGDAESKLGARYSARDLTVALDASFAAHSDTVKGSVGRQARDGLSYGADATYSLTDSHLIGYGARFGFRDPKEFKSFLVEYHRNAVPEVPEDQFDITLESTIGQLMMRGSNRTTLKGGSLSMGQLGVHGAYPLDDDLAVIGGVSQGYGPDRTIGTMPEVGVQYKKIPILVGYDTNSKAWSIRLTIPFGR